MDNRITQIALHYGWEHQKKKALEEMGELICALARDDMENTIEELADVLNMIEQLIVMVGPEKVALWKNFKLERQMEKIRDEEKTQSELC